MGALFSNISDGEPGIPITWNTRLQQLEDAILSQLDAGDMQVITPWFTIGSDTATLTLSSIPQNYRHLLLKMNMIIDFGGAGPGEIAMQLWVNSDTNPGQNQRGEFITGPVAVATDPAKGLWFNSNKDKTAKPTPANTTIYFPHYSSTAYKKCAIGSVYLWRDGANSFFQHFAAMFALAASSPITSISIAEQAGAQNINSDTALCLFGVL